MLSDTPPVAGVTLNVPCDGGPLVVTIIEAVADPQDREKVNVDWMDSEPAGTTKYKLLTGATDSCFTAVNAGNATKGSFMLQCDIQGMLVSTEPCNVSLVAGSMLVRAALDDVNDMRAALASNTLNNTVAEPWRTSRDTTTVN